MSNKAFKYAIQGVTLALLIYVTTSSVVPLLFTNAYAQGSSLFSVTIIAPTGGNTVRRQYASIITSNLIGLGIDAKLFYVNFDQLVNREFFINSEQGATFDKGGYDMGFIGWGFTSPVPDFRSNFDGRPGYLAPSGNNWALYNNAELNQLFDDLYTSTDTTKQVDLTHKMQEIVFHDKPYNYVYEVIDTIPRDQKWTDYGSKNVYSVVTFPDVQHWAGGTDLTFAEAGNVFPGNTLNPAQTANSNSFYALYIYGAISFAGAGLQEIDARDLSFYPALATNIQSSPNGLDWKIQLRQGATFQSGVEITADDFVWTQWAITNPKTASVGLGSNIQYLGNVVDFTFLDGKTVTVDNRATPDEALRKGSWKVIDKYNYEFHMPDVYAFTRQTYAAGSPLPKHILEQFPSDTWDSLPFSTASGPVTYKWDTTKYGGSGSYTAVGPVGAGPYYLESFDFTRNLATMKKYAGYWNATGLEALGQFTVDTYKVVWIGSKDAALAALKNGEVNVLDNNFQLGRDKPTLQQMGVNIISAAELGWQEQGFNMKHPIFGTGTDTPLGKQDASKAAEAARHVRTAISYLIPRDQIVNELLAGLAYPLATLVGPGWGVWYNPNIKPDPYDVSKAADELTAAGYTVNYVAPKQIAYSGNPMLGSGSITINGVGRAAHEMLIVQQSTDGGTTWTDFAAAVSGNDTKYQISAPAPPAFGTVWYRANFTGYVLNETLSMAPITPDLVNQYINTEQYFGGRPLLPGLVTDPIAVSSMSNDTMVVGLIVVIILVVVGAVVWKSRKKKPQEKKA
jgi:ABC-type transport system substrate-binding protein